MALGDEKQSFSRRLREALKRAQSGARGPAAIAREFNLRYAGTPVTVQAVHKWISGKALPSQDKLRALALWLEVSPQWLRFGEPESAPGRALRQDAAAYRVDSSWLSRKYEALSDQHKRMIVELVVALLRLEDKR
jgi:transcriptional regulator with XRE-family HTH domain